MNTCKPGWENLISFLTKQIGRDPINVETKFGLLHATFENPTHLESNIITAFKQISKYVCEVCGDNGHLCYDETKKEMIVCCPMHMEELKLRRVMMKNNN